MSDMPKTIWMNSDDDDGEQCLYVSSEWSGTKYIRADLVDELVEALGIVTAHLAAAHSLLQHGGKKAAASNTIFEIMLKDYEKSIDAGRAALAGARGEG